MCAERTASPSSSAERLSTDRDATGWPAGAATCHRGPVTEGTPLFDRPGIELDRDLEWIHRDQYVYYLEVAHALGDPADWASFRSDLAEALAAAFSLQRTPPWAEDRGDHDRRTRERVLDILDSMRFRHHPAADWDGFFDDLWERRSKLRDDL